MNLRDLDYFVALAKTGHFGRAASLCGVSQPTLSRQVKRLEDDLGGPLVERCEGLPLTALGREVLPLAQQITALSADLLAVAGEHSQIHSTQLRIGVFPTLGPFLLPHILGRLQDQLPQVRCSVTEQRTAQLLTGLHEGRLDVAVVAAPVGSPGLVCEPAFREDFVLAVGHQDPLAVADDPVDAEELRGSDLILMSEGHCLRDQVLQVCGSPLLAAGDNASVRGSALPSGRLQADSMVMLRELVAAGFGRTLLPRMSVTDPMPVDPRIVLREFIAPAPHRDIVLCARPSVFSRPAVLVLLDVLRSLPSDMVCPSR